MELYDFDGNLIDKSCNEGFNNDQLVTLNNNAGSYYIMLYYYEPYPKTTRLLIHSLSIPFSLGETCTNLMSFTSDDYKSITSPTTIYTYNQYGSINTFVFKTTVTGNYKFIVESTTSSFVYVSDVISNNVKSSYYNESETINIKSNNEYLVLFGQTSTTGCLDCDEHDSNIILTIKKV